MKILSVRRVTVESTPVCDVTVAGLENFCLSSGAVVHNSKDISDSLAAITHILASRREVWAVHGVPTTEIPESFRNMKDRMKKDDTPNREFAEPIRGGSMYSPEEEKAWEGMK